jgi:septal ring factor EnvC (AmiA/AmiB activator)
MNTDQKQLEHLRSQITAADIEIAANDVTLESQRAYARELNKKISELIDELNQQILDRDAEIATLHEAMAVMRDQIARYEKEGPKPRPGERCITCNRLHANF